MPDYVVLMKLTQQGARSITDLPQFAERVRASWQTLGGSVRELLVTMGQYDLVLVGSSESELNQLSLSFQTALEGNLTATTLRAFTLGEADQALAPMKPPR